MALGSPPRADSDRSSFCREVGSTGNTDALMDDGKRPRGTHGEPGLSPGADSASSDEVTAGESSHMFGLTISRQTDTPGLMNPDQEPDRKELQTEIRIDEVELGIDKD